MLFGGHYQGCGLQSGLGYITNDVPIRGEEISITVFVQLWLVLGG